jgi:hypothetical protein
MLVFGALVAGLFAIAGLIMLIRLGATWLID